MTAKAQLRAYLGWEWVAGARDADSLAYTKAFVDGNDSGEIEGVYSLDDVVELSAAATTYDLTALVRNVLGDATHTTTFVTIKGILIVNTSTAAGAGTLPAGHAAANEWSAPFGADGDIVEVPPDSPLLVANRQCGWLVDATNKNLKIAASGGDVTYSMAIIGALSLPDGGCSGSV